MVAVCSHYIFFISSLVAEHFLYYYIHGFLEQKLHMPASAISKYRHVTKFWLIKYKKKYFLARFTKPPLKDSRHAPFAVFSSLHPAAGLKQRDDG